MLLEELGLHPLIDLNMRLGEASGAAVALLLLRAALACHSGMATFAAAARKAVTTVLSGPAGGVTAGAYACRMTGFQNIITFDMGGTSCDVALIKDGEPSVAGRGKIEGRDLAVPMMDINTVSAGGGTIASVDRFGVLKVGPESAGANPGPICYGRGGTEPTVTDANPSRTPGGIVIAVSSSPGSTTVM